MKRNDKTIIPMTTTFIHRAAALCFVITVVAIMTAMSAQAQIPANVKEVLDKCDEQMNNPSGLVLDVTLNMKILVVSGNGTMKCYSKGDKNFTTMTMKVLGQEIIEESGFDGQQEWEYTSATSKKEKDSLIITKTTVAKKNDYGMNMDYENSYKTAKMKEKGSYYEIDFSNRLDPELPKKMTMKVSKDTYYLREMTTSMSGAKVTMTVTKITKGCSDNWFKLDMNRYKNAVVVRK
jgi:hypothetical protein